MSETATASAAATSASPLDLERIRADFPAATQLIRDKPYIYLDSAATALKPQAVIDAVTSVYARDCGNIHRAVHVPSQRATERYEAARTKVARFLGAGDPREVIFCRGTTEAINLIAQTYGRANVGDGDEIVITGLEHHSNIVPWQMLCELTGAALVVVPITDAGEVPLDEIDARIGPRTKIVAFPHVSNALGTVLPVADICRLARARGAATVIDGAQAAPHVGVDVGALECDFYAFSGHKLYGPSGVGGLFGRKDLLDAMPPWQGGGDMIRSVTFEKTTYADVPAKFEAGTPNIAGVVGLGAAIDYITDVGIEALEAHERDVLAYGTEALEALDGVTLLGTAADKVAILSFVMDCAHPHDIGTIVDAQGVAIRTGHHCAQPVMERFGVPATARASLGLYNTREDIDALVRALTSVREMFA